jgi:outer membrane lipase/esterase
MNGNNKTSTILQRPAGKTLFWATGLLMLGTVSSASAQLIEPGPLPGAYTELQLPVANGIFRTCANLVNGLHVTPLVDGTPTQRLAAACSMMVNTARFANGIAGNAKFDLKLSNGELATAIQAIAPVQANAQKQISTETTKMNVVGARLLSLRGGARGMVVGMNGMDYQAPAVAQLSGLNGATGGGAAADDMLGGPWGGFVNVAYNWGKIDQSSLQDAYKQHSYNIVAGADYRASDSVVIGGAITYSDTNATYEQGLGSVKARTTGAIGYGTWYADGWYVDGLLSYGNADFDSRRNINIGSHNALLPSISTAATSSPKGDQWSASLGTGMDIRSDTLTITPSARLNYLHVNNKAFSEDEPLIGLGLAVGARKIESLQSAIGVRLSSNVNTASGVMLPFCSVQWMHEFKKDSPALVSRYVNDPNGISFSIPTASPASDYGVLSVGASMTMANNLSGFAQFSTALGLKNENSYAVSAGLRLQF